MLRTLRPLVARQRGVAQARAEGDWACAELMSREALFVSGALCLIAALAILSLAGRKPPKVQPMPT